MGRDYKPGEQAPGSKPFPPGKSGNPGGKPSFAKALKAHGLTTSATLVEVIGVARTMLTGKSYQERVFAVQWFTDRILGKSATSIRVTGTLSNLTTTALAAMSTEELERMLADAEAEADEDDADCDDPSEAAH